MKLRQMDPREVLAIVDGQRDLLREELVAKKRQAVRCPACLEDQLEERVDPDRPFNGVDLTPCLILRCGSCGTETDQSGILIRKG